MTAYMVAQLSVGDVETYRRYASQVGATVQPFGGRLLVASDSADVREGVQPYPRTVIGEFPTLDAGRSWYESGEYQAIRPLRVASTEGTVFIVEGFSLPAAPTAQKPEARS